MIYFFYNRAHNEVKIGFCEESRVFDRFKEIQTGCSAELQFLHAASMPGKRPEEFSLHQRFSNLRLQGEWFKVEGELLPFLFSRMTMTDAERLQEQNAYEIANHN